MIKMATTGDPYVKNVQHWLNDNYGSDSRFNRLEEDGYVGWGTINGLIRALQIELGIQQTADNFGTGTINAFNSKFPKGIVQQEDDDKSENKIYGIINSKTVQIIKNEKTLFSIISKFRQNLIKNLFKIFDKNYASFLSGLLIGDKSNIEDEMSESFRNSSLSHVLAISGMHVVYIINRS